MIYQKYHKSQIHKTCIRKTISGSEINYKIMIEVLLDLTVKVQKKVVETSINLQVCMSFIWTIASAAIACVFQY